MSRVAHEATLTLSDGLCFRGRSVGVQGVVNGELCFSTAMTGYQEVITDPSFAGQVLVFTAPHVGNVGANAEDNEANQTLLRGAVLRECPTEPSNWRSQGSLQSFFIANNVVAIADVDTRAIVLHVRDNGPLNCRIDALSNTRVVHNMPCVTQEEIMQEVSSNQKTWVSGEQGKRVVLVDYGVKLNIVRMLNKFGCLVTVVPYNSTYEEIMAHDPQGIVLSNGPGDPALLYKEIAPCVDKLVRSGIPLFGICLGHQLFALSMGCRTIKMQQGHRGINHPTLCAADDSVTITTQNHGFAVDHCDLPDNIIVTHTSLFDGSIAGLESTDLPAFSVQYHPESSPGPHDSYVLFRKFMAML